MSVPLQICNGTDTNGKNLAHIEHLMGGVFCSKYLAFATSVGIRIGIRIRIEVGIRPINLDLDEVEGEQFEDAIKSGLDNFGVAGFESENDRLEDGIGFEGREAEERRLVEIGGVTYGFELVQDGFVEMHLQISTNIYIYIYIYHQKTKLDTPNDKPTMSSS